MTTEVDKSSTRTSEPNKTSLPLNSFVNDDISESELACLQSHYELLSAMDIKSRLNTAENRFRDADLRSIFDDSNTEFDLIPIIEESTKKYTNFISVIANQLKDQQANGSGRYTPLPPMNQYSFARLKLKSQLQMKPNKPGSSTTSFQPQKESGSNSPSRSSSPRRELFEAGTGFNFNSLQNPVGFVSSGMYSNTDKSSPPRDPLLLPVLGTAAFNRQNKLLSRSYRSRSKGFRTHANDFKQLYGTSGVGTSAQLVSTLTSSSSATSSSSSIDSKWSRAQTPQVAARRTQFGRPVQPISTSNSTSTHLTSHTSSSNNSPLAGNSHHLNSFLDHPSPNPNPNPNLLPSPLPGRVVLPSVVKNSFK